MPNLPEVLDTTLQMLSAKAGTNTRSSVEKACSKKVLELAAMLDKDGVPYEKRNLFGEIDQLKFDWCDADIVCHLGSYGGERGLFEVMGSALMKRSELEVDSVKGNLPIEEAFKRIKKAWAAKQKKEAKNENN